MAAPGDVLTLVGMNKLIAAASPRQLARTAGSLSVVNIFVGFFALGYVPSVIAVTGNAAATVHNIQAHELLYRFGLAGHVVVTVTNIGLAVVSYELFKIVNRRLAMLDVFFILVATAIEAAAIIGDFVPLVLLNGAHGGLPSELLNTLAYTPVSLSAYSYDVYTVFFGFDYLIPAAILAYNATFIPRFFGPLLAIDGLGYLTNGFASMISPGFAVHLVPYILLPILVAEGSLALWFLIVGVDERRWAEKAEAAGHTDFMWHVAPA